MPDCIPTLEAAPVVCFADHTAGVATHGATVGLSAGKITQAADDAATVAHSGGGGDDPPKPVLKATPALRWSPASLKRGATERATSTTIRRSGCGAISWR